MADIRKAPVRFYRMAFVQGGSLIVVELNIDVRNS
jgi:hypothetical protein